MIYLSGYCYTQHRMTEEKRILRCEDRDCRSKCKPRNLISNYLWFFFISGCQTNIQMEILIKEPSDHSHAHDPDWFHVIQLKNEVKTRRAITYEGPSTILFDALRDTPFQIDSHYLGRIERGRSVIGTKWNWDEMKFRRIIKEWNVSGTNYNWDEM